MNATQGKTIRHCALCKSEIRSEKEVKKYRCAHCLRRAYCSKGCKIMDWTSKKSSAGQGQGHEDWCKHGAGEEDIDYKIAPSTKNHKGNGQGLFAMRLIPPRTRILVEGVGLPYSRINLANHDCLPNACWKTDQDFQARVLFSNREVQEGEEICVNYLPYFENCTKIENPFQPGQSIESFSDYRGVLGRMGVVCPTSCICHSQEIDALISSARKGSELLYTLVNNDLRKMIRSRSDAGQGLKMVKIVLTAYGGLMQKAGLLEIAFNLALFQSWTLPYTDKLKEEWITILGSILHPENQALAIGWNGMENPETYFDKYLAFDGEEEAPVFGKEDMEGLLSLV